MPEPHEDREDLTTDEEQSLFEHHHIKVEKGQVMMRLDKFIKIRVSKTTRTKVQNAC
jgi:23S rRNA pseudouridine1911/1915/1917 synthase